MMSLPQWIRIQFKVEVAGHDVTPIVNAFVAYCTERGISYFFGSLTVAVTGTQSIELRDKFGEHFDFLPSHSSNKDCIKENDWTAYSASLFTAALQNDLDLQSSSDFYQGFQKLFVLTAVSKSFSIRKETFEEVKLFCIRFSHKIEELSGLQVVVPKLSPDKSRDANRAEMMRAFISIFSAYSTFCRNTGNVNRFYWDYTVDIEGDAPGSEKKRKV